EACSSLIDFPPPDNCSKLGAGPAGGAGGMLERTVSSPAGVFMVAAWPVAGVGIVSPGMGSPACAGVAGMAGMGGSGAVGGAGGTAGGGGGTAMSAGGGGG